MEETCDIIGFVNLGFAVVCFFFNMGPFPFAENRRFNEKLEALRAKSPLYQEEVEKRKKSAVGDDSLLNPQDVINAKSHLQRTTTRHYIGGS